MWRQKTRPPYQACAALTASSTSPSSALAHTDITASVAGLVTSNVPCLRGGKDRRVQVWPLPGRRCNAGCLLHGSFAPSGVEPSLTRTSYPSSPVKTGKVRSWCKVGVLKATMLRSVSYALRAQAGDTGGGHGGRASPRSMFCFFLTAHETYLGESYSSSIMAKRERVNAAVCTITTVVLSKNWWACRL